jgi:hypothetical protein
MLKSTVSQFFSQAISQAMDSVRSDRSCQSLPDDDFVFTAIRRVLGRFNSGRDLLQTLDQTLQRPIPRSTFFDALQSQRRLCMVNELASAIEQNLRSQLANAKIDMLADFPQLANYDVFAGDGHSIAHACHAPRRHGKDFVAAKNIYLTDLRTGLLRAFAPVGGFDGSKSHEWPIFKKTLPSFLDTRSRRCLFVLDMAFIDNTFWSLQKARQQKGLFISRVRADMTPIVKIPRPIDAALPVNIGITGDFIAGFNNIHATLRIVEYTNPENGETFAFLTSDDALPPGLIAWLYFLRWTIEKLFDTLKNSLHQDKSWATGKVAQHMHSTFLAISHNLIAAFQSLLGHQAGLHDTKCSRKYSAWIDCREKLARAAGRVIHPFLKTTRRLAQVSLQFIRTLRNFLDDRRLLRDLLPHFKATLEAYL